MSLRILDDKVIFYKDRLICNAARAYISHDDMSVAQMH